MISLLSFNSNSWMTKKKERAEAGERDTERVYEEAGCGGN